MKNLFKTVLVLFILTIVISCNKDKSELGIKRVKSIGYGVNAPKIQIGTKSESGKVVAISDVWSFNGAKFVATLEEISPATKADVLKYQSVKSVDAYTFYTTSNYIREQKGIVTGGKYEVPIDDQQYGIIFLAYGENSNGFTNPLSRTTPIEITKNNTEKQISFTATNGDNVCYADFNTNTIGGTDTKIVLYPFFAQLKVDISAVVANMPNVKFASASVTGGVQRSANISVKFEQPTATTPSATENILSSKSNKFTIKYPYTANEAIDLTVPSNTNSVIEQNLIPNGKTFILNLGLSNGTTTKVNAINFYAETDTNKQNPLPLTSGTRYILNILSVNAEGEIITDIVIDGHDYVGEETLN
jgi:hypothetical protein